MKRQILPVVLVGCAGCSGYDLGDGGSGRNGDPETTVPSASVDPEFEAPAELDHYGTRLIRVDALPEDELEEMRSMATDASLSPLDRLAAELRPLVNYRGVPYIGKEPAYELAQSILDGEGDSGPVGAAEAREGRRILGSGGASGDQRVHRTTQTTPWAHTGFLQNGCTVTLVGNRTGVTAAHCLYTTFDTASPPPAGQVGWVCENGTNSGGIGVACGTYPDLAFGVEDATMMLGWIDKACWIGTIPTAWDTSVNDASRSDWNNVALYDYAVLDFTPCYTNMGLGHMGNHPNASLTSVTFNKWGYPYYATCPQNKDGNSAADCSGGSNRYNGDTTKPFNGAELWGNSTAGAAVGTNNDVLQSTIDATAGDSGSALYYVHSTLGFQLVGMLSGTWDSKNWFKRWTTATSSFVDANSAFPSDL